MFKSDPSQQDRGGVWMERAVPIRASTRTLKSALTPLPTGMPKRESKDPLEGGGGEDGTEGEEPQGRTDQEARSWSRLFTRAKKKKTREASRAVAGMRGSTRTSSGRLCSREPTWLSVHLVPASSEPQNITRGPQTLHVLLRNHDSMFPHQSPLKRKV